MKPTGTLDGTVTGHPGGVILVVGRSVADPHAGLYAEPNNNHEFHLDRVPEGDYESLLLLRGGVCCGRPVTIITNDAGSVTLDAPP